MKRAIITPAELGGAALSELKEWLAISTPHEDNILIAMLGAALDMCESFTGTMPLSAVCEEVWTATSEWQTLGARPVQAITGISGIPAEGPQFALPPDAYEVDLDADGSGRFRVLRQGSAGRVAVHFTAGLAPGWGSLPDGLRHGIIRFAGFQYRDRDTANAAAPPAAVTALWKPWRRMRIA